MQTHEWEALLSECADSWELGDAYADGSRLLLEEGSVIGTINMHITHVHEEVAAAAPAAVAEVIRLRKAIAELEAEERATADDEFYPVHLRDLCRAFADDLARILEGDTDE